MSEVTCERIRDLLVVPIDEEAAGVLARNIYAIIVDLERENAALRDLLRGWVAWARDLDWGLMCEEHE